jgi:predicted permease
VTFWRKLFRSKGVFEDSLSEELRFHLEQQVAANRKAGMAPQEAWRQARLQFGAAEGVKAECREERRGVWLESLWQDVRYALRTLRKSPGFATVAVLTLALGIGANTAIFSVVHGVLIAPLPYAQPDRLVMVWENNPHFPRVWVSYPNFHDWQQGARSFERIAAFRESGSDLTAPGAPEHLQRKEISAGFFSALGTPPALGREFLPEENRSDAPPVAVISNRLWKDKFAGDPHVVGKSISLDGTDFSVVGVAPPDFRIESGTDVYTPLGRVDPITLDNRGSHDGIFAFARLAPGVSVAQSQSEMNAIQAALDRAYPEANRDLGIFVEPLKRVIVGDVSSTLLLLLGAVGLVLLIACANVANLLLARSAGRSREFAVRAALGASRTRIVRHLLTESVLLSLAGAALGLVMTVVFTRSILATLTENLPRRENVGVDASVLWFTLGISFAAGIVFGLAPSLRNSSASLESALKEGSRSWTSRQPLQSTLVISQMALTLVLLVGAGLLFRSIERISRVNPGFDAEGVITLKVGVSPSLTKTAESTRVAYRELAERIRKIPGVEEAEFTGSVPLTGAVGTMPFWINSRRPASLQGAPRVAMYLVGPDYLHAMKIPLLEGRFFTTEDTTKSPCVVAIDSVLARQYFSGSDPLGQTISAGFATVGPCRIVGVVGHVQGGGLGNPIWSSLAEAYFPLYQDPDAWVASQFPNTTLLIRTPLTTAALTPAVKAAAGEVASNEPVYAVRTMEQVAAESMSPQRFPMILIGGFAGLALLLASVGIYGVISYGVAQRVNEIGIRMAVGAGTLSIFRLIVGQGLRLAFAGVAIGGAAALVLTRAVTSFSRLLYGVSASDFTTFAAVALLLVFVAALACCVPARRAMRVDPMVALRYE